MKVGLKKLKSHEGIVVKALVNSEATNLFIDTKFAKEKGFKLEKLKNPLSVQNIDRTINVEGIITYQVECNMFFKRHIERAQMDICNLKKTKVILDMLWLAVYNLEIDWEKEKVKITQYPLIYGKRKQKIQKKKQVKKIEKEKIVEELIEKWYKKSERKYKVLATVYSQVKNKVKIEKICKTVESQLMVSLSINAVGILNNNRLQITVYISNTANIKTLLEIITLYIPNHKDLVSFCPIVNKPNSTIYFFITIINVCLSKKANYYVLETEVTKFLHTI